MQSFIYILIFIIGIIFGNFSNIAIYKILKKNNKEKKFLNNWKINILTGLASIGIFSSLHFSFTSISVLTIIQYIYLMIFISTLVIIATIDRTNKKICKSVVFSGCIIGGVYIVYLYIIKNVEIFSIYRYVIYLIVVCFLSAITTKYRYFKYSYLLEVMMICIYMNMFVISEVFLITAVLTMISLTAGTLIKKYNQKIDNSDILAENIGNLDIPIGMYLCLSNIVAMIISGIEFIKI